MRDLWKVRQLLPRYGQCILKKRKATQKQSSTDQLKSLHPLVLEFPWIKVLRYQNHNFGKTQTMDQSMQQQYKEKNIF